MLTITYIVLGVSGGLWVMSLMRTFELTNTQPHAGIPKTDYHPNSAFRLVTTGNTTRESPLCD
jgi:hypothetical protein